MRVQPVKGYGKVRYPSALNGKPDVTREVPVRWRGNALILATLAGAGVLVSCARAHQEPVLAGKIAIARDLTESDVREIVLAEAKKMGIKFAHKAKKIKLKISSTKSVDYNLDETVTRSGVSVDYVSNEDVERVYGKNTKKTPAQLAKKIEASITNPKEKTKIKVVPQKAQADYNDDEKLRKEIRQFLKWLKSQGVI